MATLAIVKKCIEHNKQLGRKTRHTNGRKTFTPDLKLFFGVKNVVDMSKPIKLSEADKRRHKYEDAMLSFMYIEN